MTAAKATHVAATAMASHSTSFAPELTLIASVAVRIRAAGAAGIQPPRSRVGGRSWGATEPGLRSRQHRLESGPGVGLERDQAVMSRTAGPGARRRGRATFPDGTLSSCRGGRHED